MLILYCVVFSICVITNVRAAAINPTAVNYNWWKNAVIYQIYPRSFKDSDNSGTGDIQGIIDKLPHLKDAGITAAWLSPIYASPHVDHGYDISDYTAIDPLFGTIEDFDRMVRDAHDLGIKIVMDFVPNHSSNKHDWFVKSELKEEEFKDYYVWKDGAPDKPPNNWISLFKGQAWTYSDKRNQWYLHQFAKEQPDLNYRSEAVVKKMQEVLKFWLDRGVDGFRMDAVPYLVEDVEFKDEPSANNPNAKPEDYESLNHTYTTDHVDTFKVIYDWRTFIDRYNDEHNSEDPRIMMTEAYTTLENTMKYYTDGVRNGAHFTFNFFFITDLLKTSTASDIIALIEKWMKNMPPDCVANWVIGNHDNHRVATRFGTERIDGMNMLISFLPGVMVTYNGEEIGMENGKVAWEDCEDPRACKGRPEDYESFGRDFERTPYHWDDSTNAGFNDGGKPWLPVSEKYKTNNLKAQKKPGIGSHYRTYQALLKLRKETGFADASVTYTALSDNVLVLTRNASADTTYVSVINIGPSREKIDLSQLITTRKHFKVIVAGADSKKSNRVLAVNDVVVEPYESFVGKTIPDVPMKDMEWWKNAQIYQIYPLSFKDDNNDGNGDLRGIINKLSHVKDIGATAIWIGPIYKSAGDHQGYDVTNHLEIDQAFGNMNDFDELVSTAHRMGIKIIMEFIPNHTSKLHDWFVQSTIENPEYDNFYIWKQTTSSIRPPNKWQSLYGGDAWTYDYSLKLWYLHQTTSALPDLNYRNPVVVEKMKDILRFWMDKGVDGFRVHGAPYLFESETFDNDQQLTINQPETFDMIYQWREVVDDYVKEHGGDARILLTDAPTDISKVMEYYGNEERAGSHISYNYEFMNLQQPAYNAREVVLLIKKWLAYMPLQYTANWMLGSHDYHRAATRLGKKNADGFNMLVSMLPGVMLTYNGEEIGQENGKVTWEQCQDPRACDGVSKDFEAKSRDFQRTPYQWDDRINAGFNRNQTPWLPVSAAYIRTNLAKQIESVTSSHYQVYKELAKLRKVPTLRTGKLELVAITDNTLGCTRTLENHETYIFLFNVGEKYDSIDLNEVLRVDTPYVKVVLHDSQSLRTIGDLLPSNRVLINAHESIIAVATREEPTTTTTTTTTTEKPGTGAAAEVSISFMTFLITLFCILVAK